jgi:hypothetical protein
LNKAHEGKKETGFNEGLKERFGKRKTNDI